LFLITVTLHYDLWIFSHVQNVHAILFYIALPA